MKKIINIVLLLVLALTLCLTFVGCDSESSSVSNEKGLHFKKTTKDGNTYYIVTGYTTEDDFNGTLAIPATHEDKHGNEFPVKEIKANAFEDNATVKELTVPASVTKIGTGAFAGMTKLSKVILPFVGVSADSVDANRTFASLFGTEEYTEGVSVTCSYNPENSTTVYVPKTLAEVVLNNAEDYVLPAYAFAGMKYLSTITLNEKVVEVREYAFNGCESLGEVALTNVTKIGAYAFEGCDAFTAVVFGNGLTTIGEGAFKGTNIAAITIPDSVTEVGAHAFENMTKLRQVTFGSGYTTIKAYTFAGCTALTSVSSTYVTSVSPSAFYNCSSSLQTSFGDK